MSGNTSARKEKFQLPPQKEQPGCLLVPAKNEGNEMYQEVLIMNGNVYARRNLCHLTIDEINYEYEKIKRKEFDDEIKRTHGDSM